MAKTNFGYQFHDYGMAYDKFEPLWQARLEPQFTYLFQTFFHPYVGELISTLNKQSLSGLFDPKTSEALVDRMFFAESYTLLRSSKVLFDEQYPPIKSIDLQSDGPYANYNWELLFHVPFTIAVHLSKNQRFAEAQKWFHFIFDPTCNDETVPAPQRFWKFLYFREKGMPQRIEELLNLLRKPDSECSITEKAAKASVLEGYHKITKSPFQPHVVARTRPLAYQYSVVMKYLDNLIAWGDSLFRQDTIESINEATQRYVLAANLLGPRPMQVLPKGTVRPKTFAELRAAGIDQVGNAFAELEAEFPFNLPLPAGSQAGEGDAGRTLFGIGRTLYFCIPRNEKLLSYWDIVGDRLYKIRHCMNIEGVVRQLALFDPPIDPAMLVKAAAAGIDLGTIISGLNQPVSPVRSLFLVQKALELTAEVRGLGSSLLSTLEKADGEKLSLLRQGHEIKIHQMTQEVKFLQWKQAQEATESLLRSRATALERYRFYLRVLGGSVDGALAPEALALDRRELSEENFDDAYAALVEQYEKAVPLQNLPNLRLAGGSSPAQQSGASGSGNLYLNTNEDGELNTHLPFARDARLAASVASVIGSVLTFIPEFNVNLHFWGLGGSSKIFGGSKLADAVKIGAEILQTVAAYEQDQAGLAARTASYERRADDWMLQANLASRELQQIGRQIIGALIAEQVARREYVNTQTQIAQAQEVDRFMREKFTNEELYLWMKGETSRLYYEYYRFAFDTARKAERTMKHELMRPEVDATDFVKFNYWDAGRKGLLSGEALHLDVKRMELAFHDNNRREFEITKHVSLRQLDPFALLTLKITGKCQVTIPEWLYDLDCPGHYMRRIKTVSLSLPSVSGPYTSVNCKLSLLRSALRKSALLSNGEYAPSEDDTRFVRYSGSLETIVTSSGTNDSGLFEPNLRDERFLPFEGAGAESTFRLELPSDFRPFDYATISDAILHIRYTAREGGEQLGRQALAEFRDKLSAASSEGLSLLLALREDFPSEWSAFRNGTADLAIALRKELFPYFVQSQGLSIDGLELYASNGAKVAKRNVSVPPDLGDELNGPEQSGALIISADASVLRREEQPVFLIVRYSLA